VKLSGATLRDLDLREAVLDDLWLTASDISDCYEHDPRPMRRTGVVHRDELVGLEEETLDLMRRLEETCARGSDRTLSHRAMSPRR
jgi:hypothetical protein